MDNLIQRIIAYINNIYYPKTRQLKKIEGLFYDLGFKDNAISKHSKEWNELCSIPITKFDIKTIAGQGFSVYAPIRYIHKTIKMTTCRYIKKKNNKDAVIDALQCPIYKSMKMENAFTENNLNHLFEFVHFKDEYNEKAKCKCYQKCKSFIALQSGANSLDDRCHMKLYSHPPRDNRQKKLCESINAFIFNTAVQENYPVHEWEVDDISNERKGDNKLIQDECKIDAECGFMNALIDEVIQNGFKYDLCLLCNKKQDCCHNVKKNNMDTLISVVDEKLLHWRHLVMDSPINRAQMLSLLLYSGGDCNYDLCKSQRDGNYTKWKWFDHCLYHAISTLSAVERGTFKLYSGLASIKLDKKSIRCGFLPTYTSFSWSRHVAQRFMGDGEGMILEVDEKYRNKAICCDVSWISKFPDECEVLFARTTTVGNDFCLTVLDESNGVQTVSLNESDFQHDEEKYDVLRSMQNYTVPCVCGANYIAMYARTCYGADSSVYCDICQAKQMETDLVYHCDKNSKHPDGCDVCIKCVVDIIHDTKQHSAKITDSNIGYVLSARSLINTTQYLLPYKKGDLVKLVDLTTKQELNGKIGVVVGSIFYEEQTWPIRVIEIKKDIKILSKNLVLIKKKNDFDILDYQDKIESVLSVNGIFLENKIEIVFNKYRYINWKSGLIDDICDIILRGNDDDISNVSHLFKHEFNCNDPQQREQIYDIILQQYAKENSKL